MAARGERGEEGGERRQSEKEGHVAEARGGKQRGPGRRLGTGEKEVERARGGSIWETGVEKEVFRARVRATVRLRCSIAAPWSCDRVQSKPAEQLRSRRHGRGESEESSVDQPRRAVGEARPPGARRPDSAAKAVVRARFGVLSWRSSSLECFRRVPPRGSCRFARVRSFLTHDVKCTLGAPLWESRSDGLRICG